MEKVERVKFYEKLLSSRRVLHVTIQAVSLEGSRRNLIAKYTKYEGTSSRKVSVAKFDHGNPTTAPDGLLADIRERLTTRTIRSSSAKTIQLYKDFT